MLGLYMGLLRGIAASAAWFALWFAIPATLLYPVALWAMKHTSLSQYALEGIYIYSVVALFFPTGFLVDLIYRRFLRDRRK
jgi:hypothetical protein